MSMNPKWELQAKKEGALYFDEDFDSLQDKNKYKHKMYLNTGFCGLENTIKNF